MRTLRLILILTSLVFFSLQRAHAADEAFSLVIETGEGGATDTLRIFFILNEWDYRGDYRDNAHTVSEFARRVRQRFAGIRPEALQLTIYAGASPEGPAAWNVTLGKRRGATLAAVLRQELGDIIANFSVVNEAARWDAFRQRIAETDEPWRDEVLEILSEPLRPDELYQLSRRELRLRRLHGGTVWQQLLEHYLPEFRSSGTAVVSLATPPPPVLPPEKAVLPPEPQKAPEPLSLLPPLEKAPWPPCWAVKTNLPLWGVVAPNVSVEYPLGRKNRWSIEAEYIHPWWIWHKNARANQCMNFGIEMRLWLGNRQRHPWLDGHHIGLACASGYFDFEWKRHKGYQGEYIHPYLNYGYQHRFSRHWALDVGIGIGIIDVDDYRYYEADAGDRHLMWQKTARWKWIGPSHANLSLVYTFDLKRLKPAF